MANVITQWLNPNNFSVLRDKFNAVISVLSNGNSGDLLVKYGSGDGEFSWKKNPSIEIIKGLIGGYDPEDLIILWGCEIVDSIPGTSTIAEGSIFYNDVIYSVNYDSVITESGETLVFKIDETNPNTIYLVGGDSESGIADYDGTNVKKLLKTLLEKLNEEEIKYTTSASADLVFGDSGLDIFTVIPSTTISCDLLILFNAQFINSSATIVGAFVLYKNGLEIFRQAATPYYPGQGQIGLSFVTEYVSGDEITIRGIAGTGGTCVISNRSFNCKTF